MNADLLLVIDHSDTQVTLNGRALRVRTGQAPPRHVPLGLLGLVVVHGKALVACDVWRALADRQIPAVLQPGRGPGASVWMGAALGTTVALRTAQHRAADRPELCLASARRLLAAKLTAQARAAELIDLGPAPASHGADLRARLSAAGQELARTPSLAGLMGHEGTAAAAWYQSLAARLPPHWQFQGRNRRPPRDPVNALLSLGYTLLGGEMLGSVQQAGLDPARGLLHGLVPGRESLVLDLIEPLRPSVDVVILGLLDSLLAPGDFTHGDHEGCLLAKAARGRFYQAWAQARQDWPNLHAARPVAAANESAAVTTLAQLCRHQTELLRADIQALMPAMSHRAEESASKPPDPS
jgi:CRISPR-associated protein Cas1